MNKKNTAMPTNMGLQLYSTGINDKYEFDAAIFEAMPIVDNTHRHPKTGAADPSEMQIDAAKDWVDNGSKL